MSYFPNHPTDATTPEKVATYVYNELQKLAEYLNDNKEALKLETLHAEPEKPRVNMLVCADGSDWNPDGASGAGLYIYAPSGIGNNWLIVKSF